MRTFKVITEARACKEIPGYTPIHNKPFGYVIQMTPPIISFKEWEDVEGIGRVRFNPSKKVTQNIVGWYKHKNRAEERKKEVENIHYWKTA